MTTTTQPPFKFVEAGKAFSGTPKWDVFSTIDGTNLGFTAHATSKRNGTIWMAATPDGKRVGHGHRSREAAALALLEREA
jgi:hypothetical protein